MKHDIIAPRWHDRVVLIADYKIGQTNIIVFRANSMPGEYKISGQLARSFPLEDMRTKSGTIMKMRAIPLDALEAV